MAPKYPSIPEPTLEPTSLRDSILSLKQAFEVLTGQRGNHNYAAVTFGDGFIGGGTSIDYDTAQDLTEAQQAQARENVYAAPLDALAYNGMQVNGSMEVAQYFTGTTIPAGTLRQYFIDGWSIAKTGPSILAAYQYNTVEVPGYRNAMQLTATTPQASIGSDFVRLNTIIEGYRVVRLAWGTAGAAPLTVGFWIRTTLLGTYRAIVYNFAGTVFSPWISFTVLGAHVWQWVTIQFPAQPTGTWVNNQNPSLVFEIEAASSAVPNIVGATSQFFDVTGVIMLPGIEMPSAERAPFITRPFDQELHLCKRYWRRDRAHAAGNAAAASALIGVRVQYAPEMRVSPTVSLITVGTASNVGARATTAVQTTGTTVYAQSTGATTFAEFQDDLISDARL